MRADFWVDGRVIDSKDIKVPHCIANSGCRNIIREFGTPITDTLYGGSVTVALALPKEAEIWIVSFYFLSP